MSIGSMMYTSASGMAVQGDRIGAVAENIANVSTTGYKRAWAELLTLVPSPGNLDYQPGSVQSVMRRGIAEQGGLSYTQYVTDLAIDGEGFFVVGRNEGEAFLTRAGAFVPNSDGVLVNSAGYQLLGYPLDGQDPAVVVNGAAGLMPVSIGTLSMRAMPSRQGNLQVNLPAGAGVVAAADLPSANAANATYSQRTSLVTYDNLGGEVTLDIYFSKTGTGTWQVDVFNRADASASPSGFPYASGPLGSFPLTFDPSSGQLTSASTLSIPVPGGQTVALDMAGSSQFDGAYVVQSADVDGNAAVAVSRFEIGGDGVLTAVYENGARVASYKIPLATVVSPDRLTNLSGNVFLPSSGSGGMQIGEAGEGGLGSIVSGALEQSTVDLAGELATMIEAQRNYTANSRVFQTSSELMDVIVNLKR